MKNSSRAAKPIGQRWSQFP